MRSNRIELRYRGVPSDTVYQGPVPWWRVWYLTLLRVMWGLPEEESLEPIRVYPVDVVVYGLLAGKYAQRYRYIHPGDSWSDNLKDAVSYSLVEELYDELAKSKDVELLFPYGKPHPRSMRGVLRTLRSFGYLHYLRDDVWITSEGFRYLWHRLGRMERRETERMAECLGLEGEDGDLRKWIGVLVGGLEGASDGE